MTLKTVEFEEMISSDDESIGPPVELEEEIFNNLSVSLNVKAGDLETTVGNLLSLNSGQILEMNQSVDQPIKLHYGDRLVAEGILVASDEKMGFKVTSVNFSYEGTD
jgi:flagellar motor switch protein FliN